METSAKIYVAGHRGLAGSAIVRALIARGYDNLLVRERGELDLCDQRAVTKFFEEQRPRYVFLAAARVGGIHANNSQPAAFIYDNLAIQTHVIHAAWQSGVRRLLFLGSSCIYPRLAPQPMREDSLLGGPLEPTNEPYAIAKIAGLKMCEAYNRQYGSRFVAVMPTNLYGPNDNFDLHGSHVLPALLRKFHEAKTAGLSTVKVWGTGTPRREFLHADDMASGCLFVMNLADAVLDAELCAYPRPNFINLGTGSDVTIRELAELVGEVVGYQGQLTFDPSKPDGAPRKLLDVSRMRALGWHASIGLREGIAQSYAWFLRHQAEARL